MTSFALKPGTEDWPLVTGTGAGEEALRNVEEGYQSVTVYTDAQSLVDRCVQWVQSAEGKTLSDQTVFNGVMDVPTYLPPFTAVDQENYKNYLQEE